jgi:hypothetical protein
VTAGTSFTFTVSATNKAGTSRPSAASNPVTTPAPAQPPDAPRNLTVNFTPTGADGAGITSVRWDEPDLRGATLLRYEVTLSAPGKPDSTQAVTTASVGFNSPQDFDACQLVSFDVRAVTSAGGQELAGPPASEARTAMGSSCPGAGSTMRLSPSSDTVAAGSTRTATVTVEIGSQPVNAVQANLSFPSAQLNCADVVVNSSAWGVTAEKTCTDSEVRVAVGTTTPRSGNQQLATVTFNAVGPGSADVRFTSGSSVLAADGKASETLESTSDASYTVTG